MLVHPRGCNADIGCGAKDAPLSVRKCTPSCAHNLGVHAIPPAQFML
jgi:hypothetical protein